MNRRAIALVFLQVETVTNREQVYPRLNLSNRKFHDERITLWKRQL